MKKIMPAILGVVFTVGLIAVLMLPDILNLSGLHPKFAGEKFNLAGHKVLIICTSHDMLGDTGKKTGVYASEMTVPYYEFLDNGMTVDVASIRGGEIPIEPISLRWPVKTPADDRYLKDPAFQDKVKNSRKIDDIDFTQYGAIYIAGGWGASYDLGTSEILGEKVTKANAKNIVLGSVCHGALGFLRAKKENGEPLLKNKKVTAVTNKQVKELGIEITPMHPETEMKKAGAVFESKTAFQDIFANHVVIDGNLVTGQNQNAGKEVAQKMMRVIQGKAK
jgi:putative intracellular protease/amidase